MDRSVNNVARIVFLVIILILATFLKREYVKKESSNKMIDVWHVINRAKHALV